MPAAFVVQSDLGTTLNANAYIDVATFRQYHLDRGHDTTSLTDAAVQIGIVLSTDYADLRWRLRLVGTKLLLDGTQQTEFPRQNAFRDNGIEITGIPPELKKAVSEYALRAAVSPLLVDVPAPIVNGERVPTTAIKSASVTVGPITDSKTYADDPGGYGTGTILIDGCLFITIPAADLYMEPLLGLTSRQRRVIRA